MQRQGRQVKQPVLRFSLLQFLPAFAIIGAANNQREWLGALVGGAIGLFFALLLMGLLPAKILNWMFPEKQQP